MKNWISDTPAGCQLNLYVQPGAKKSEVVGLHDDRLKIKIKAPPEDGKANDELIRFLADILNVQKNEVEILRGHKSRQKDVLVRGITAFNVTCLINSNFSFALKHSR